jgi:phage portal protein BeeE
MPPHMVGMLDRATFSNIEQQSVEFVMYTIAPWIEGIEQAAQRDLLLGDDRSRYFVEFNVAGLMRGDFQTRMQGYAWGRQWGWLSVNDIRALENLPSIGEAGDVYLQPMNMVPAGSEPEDSDSTAPGGPGLGAPANEPDAKPQDDPDAD